MSDQREDEIFTVWLDQQESVLPEAIIAARQAIKIALSLSVESGDVASARRIKACLNACAVIPTERLERVVAGDSPAQPFVLIAREYMQQCNKLLKVARAARQQILEDRDCLFECHKNLSTGAIDPDDLAHDALKNYAAILNNLDSAIAEAEQS